MRKVNDEKTRIRSKGRAVNNTGSVRQRANGTWEGRVVTGVDPATGKTIRRSVYGDKEKDVRRKMTEIQRSLDTNTYIEPDNITVAEWLEEWLETFCKPKLKDTTFGNYTKFTQNHIIPALGQLRLQDVKGIHIQRMYNQLLARGLKPSTVKSISIPLHKAFEVAVKQGLISVNPCSAAEHPSAKKKEIHPLSDAEIVAFLRAIKGKSFENAFALCLFAGLREGECLGLSWRQIDFDKGTILVDQQAQRDPFTGGNPHIEPSTKSGKDRVIRPPAIAFEYLRDEKRRQAEKRLKAGAAWDNPDDLVFTTRRGRIISLTPYYGQFKKAAAAIGRPDLRPHDLRHTAATVAIASGADVKSVQSLLGHATAAFTLDVYAHTSERMMQDTAERVQSYYDSITDLL